MAYNYEDRLIYLPNFMGNKIPPEGFEKFFKNMLEGLAHEILHKILHEQFGEERARKLDNIDKKDCEYLISVLD
jgi:hypothetical protein